MDNRKKQISKQYFSKLPIGWMDRSCYITIYVIYVKPLYYYSNDLSEKCAPFNSFGNIEPWVRLCEASNQNTYEPPI